MRHRFPAAFLALALLVGVTGASSLADAAHREAGPVGASIDGQHAAAPDGGPDALLGVRGAPVTPRANQADRGDGSRRRAVSAEPPSRSPGRVGADPEQPCASRLARGLLDLLGSPANAPPRA